MEPMDSRGGYYHRPPALPPPTATAIPSASTSSASASSSHASSQSSSSSSSSSSSTSSTTIASHHQLSEFWPNTKAQLNSPQQNVNLVEMPVGVHYQRRKYNTSQVPPPPAEFQSRIYLPGSSSSTGIHHTNGLSNIRNNNNNNNNSNNHNNNNNSYYNNNYNNSNNNINNNLNSNNNSNIATTEFITRSTCQEEYYPIAVATTPLPQPPSLSYLERNTTVVSPLPNLSTFVVHRVIRSQIQTGTTTRYVPNTNLSNVPTNVFLNENTVLNYTTTNIAVQNSPGPSTNYSAQISTTDLQQAKYTNIPNYSKSPTIASATIASSVTTATSITSTTTLSSSTTSAAITVATTAAGAATATINCPSRSSAVPTPTNYGKSVPSTSTAAPRPLQNVIPTCVYLMSRIAVHMEIEDTAQCPAQVMLAAALGCDELGIANKLLAQSVFDLWMTSQLLEIQLKAHNRPYAVRLAWLKLLEKYSHGNIIEKDRDEPMIVLRRSVFFSKRDEEKIKDPKIIELLYEEARHNVLNGRYVMEPVHSTMLGGIQARIELGPYNVHAHTNGFFRENQSRFLPQHVAKNCSWSWLPISRKTSAEIRLLEQFKRVPATATTRKLMRKYLEFCWALPFYGAAFFHGQVEKPVRGLMSLVNHQDVPILVGINEKGVFIIDHMESTLLLGLRYEELSWDFAKPSLTDDSDCLPCIFIQFDAVENGIYVSKLMQIFSRQAAMMDALIVYFTDQMRRRREGTDGQDECTRREEPNPIQNNGVGVLSNKLSRLTLATFDDENRCIGQMGSLSIRY